MQMKLLEVLKIWHQTLKSMSDGSYIRLDTVEAESGEEFVVRPFEAFPVFLRCQGSA